MSEINPSESALAERTDDPIRPILEGSPSEKSLALSMGGCERAVRDRLLVSSEERLDAAVGDCDASVSDAFFLSFIGPSPTTSDLLI